MNKTRNIYLNMKTLKEARKIIFERFSSPEKLASEIISAPDAVGVWPTAP